MKIIKINKYITPFGVIEFYPVNLPDYSHVVMIGGVKSNLWLSNKNKPDLKSATFFARILAARKEGKPDYFYTDTNTNPKEANT